MPEIKHDAGQASDWYKDAVIYQLHVKSFFDSNDDGVGDLPGLLAKLDYIAGLGVTAIWLLPFYPSPRRDDGYDIADYRGVHPDYGTVADVRRLIRAAHARGLRVITELVVNHTSDQHPWFQRARRARPGSVARDYYVWSDHDRSYAQTRIIFCDTETSNWARDPVAKAYYWHRFYSHQPDLNYDNPRVLREVLNAMRFWLAMGVDGMRLDAVPYLIEREGTNNENLPETHAVLRRIRAVIDEEFPGRMLLAEANQWPEDTQQYFGQGDECHMAFHFPLMPRMYMAIAQEDRFPITDIMRQTPEIPESCQWVIFLRNHDELTLEMVTSRERDYLWNVYAADPRARLNLGIRRRLAPLLERDRRRIELMSSLLLSMPGTPVLYYGDELGMGDNIHLGDRDGVRTPMQWSGDRNGGFSRADPERLHLPVLMGPLYGYEAVNVEAQQRDPHSLLNWTRRLLARRALTPAFGRGTLQFLYPGNRKILAYLRQWQDTTILCVANLSAAAQPVELPLQGYAGQVPVEMLGETVFPTIGELPYLLTLPPFGFYWFDLSRSASPPDWHVDAPEQMPELITLVLRARGALELTEISRKVLETEVLPQYLRRQRWFAGPPLPRIRWCDALPLPEAGRVADATHGRYFWATALPAEADDMRLSIPLSLTWGEPADATYPIARIRRVAETGVLADAFSEAEFVHALVDGLAASPHGSPDGAPKGDSPRAHLRFQRIAPDWQAPPADAEVRWLSGEQSNSSAIVGDAVMIKVLRTVMAGPNAEVEMSQRLTEAGYAHTPPLLGTLEHRTADGTARTLAVFHRYVSNEGDAWTWTQETVRRLLAAAQLAGDDEDAFEAGLSGYWSFARTMGERLAMLHAVFVPADASAAPTSQTTEYRLGKARDVKQTVQRISAQLDAALRAAAQQLSATAPLGEPLQWLQEHQAELTARIQALAQDELGVARIRVHGDFHLGQVLVVQADAYLIDFEGEPLRDAHQRRALETIYKDQAGLLRSLDYAANMLSQNKSLLSPPEDAQGPVLNPGYEGISRSDRLLARFRVRAQQAFLEGYCQRQPEQLRDTPQKAARLLLLAQLEKAAYEVCYEAAHRPDWLDVPLGALRTLARSVLETPSDQDKDAS